MADWDVVVIGGGPAGLCAAAEAAAAGLSCLNIDRMGGGGELMNLGALEEVDGNLTGPDMAAQLMGEAVAAGAETAVVEVTGLTPEGPGWRVNTSDGAHIARAVIVAVGLAPGTLGVDDEISFEGRGLSHCATCDGPLFRDGPVVVAGSDRWALAEVRELAAMGCKVTLVTDSMNVQACGATVACGQIVGLEGTAGLDAVLVGDSSAAPPRRVPARAVFVQAGRRPALDFAPASLERDADGRLLTDDSLRCSLPGIYAAGDSRAGAVRTVAGAIDDGKRAAGAVRESLGHLGSGGE